MVLLVRRGVYTLGLSLWFCLTTSCLWFFVSSLFWWLPVRRGGNFGELLVRRALHKSYGVEEIDEFVIVVLVSSVRNGMGQPALHVPFLVFSVLATFIIFVVLVPRPMEGTESSTTKQEKENSNTTQGRRKPSSTTQKDGRNATPPQERAKKEHEKNEKKKTKKEKKKTIEKKRKIKIKTKRKNGTKKKK